MRNARGVSLIEYALLVALFVIAFLIGSAVFEGATKQHFSQTNTSEPFDQTTKRLLVNS